MRVKIIRFERGTKEEVVDVSKRGIHDLWHIAENIRRQKKAGSSRAAEMVLDVWHLAHELRTALLWVAHLAEEAGVDLSEPIHTK